MIKHFQVFLIVIVQILVMQFLGLIQEFYMKNLNKNNKQFLFMKNIPKQHHNQNKGKKDQQN